MTDRIDLDDLETDSEDEATGNYGDWLWRGEGDPEDEPERPSSTSETATSGARAGSDGDRGDEGDDSNAAADAGPDRTPAPHVPKTGERTPAGIPVAGDGASASTETTDTAGSEGTTAPRPMGAEAETGPHGGDADDMTMAITYAAVRDLARPDRVFADAAAWADWIGIVGDVPAHVIQKFQREHGIDADFFNGTGTGPGERLAEIDRNSMFYADRLVVVGLEGRDEPIAEAADWEFVPLETAAAKADWELGEQEP